MFIRRHKKFRDEWKENRVGLLFDVSEDEELAIMNEVFDAGRITIFKNKTEGDMVNMLFYNLSSHDKLKIIYFANMVKEWKDVKDKTVKEWKAIKIEATQKNRQTSEEKTEEKENDSDNPAADIMRFDI